MYWKESDSDDVEVIEALHGGQGSVKAHRFFEKVSRLPVRFYVWELVPGATWGSHSHFDDDPQEEVLYCLNGNGTVVVDGDAEVLVPSRKG